jgi:adenylate cyclase
MSARKKTTHESAAVETRKPRLYSIIDRFSILKKLARKGGIRFKWATVIFFTLLIVILVFSAILMVMSTRALISANDKLCHAIAGNISSTEPILTGEKKPVRRSLILQDVVSSLSNNGIPGLKYATVYDIDGKLAEIKGTYAAHSDSSKKGKWIPRKTYDEIRNISAFTKDRISIENGEEKPIPCFRYRLPFAFFGVTVGVIEIVFTEESILAPIRETAVYIIAFSAVLMVLGLYLSTKISGGMVKPIIKLTGGMHRVREGDLSAEINIFRHDEIGDLSLEFNTMISHLREKLIMQKFVSNSTISMIKENSRARNDQALDLGGARHNMAFLFSDIRGFTAMSEKLQPEDVVAILNQYLDAQAQIIKKHEGDIDKFVGDEIMAAFSGEDRAARALRAALDIIKEIRLLNEEREEQGLITVEVGIGLNIGDVVHGRMGSRDRMDNTSIGDAVNLAARLCSSADSGEILASANLMAVAEKGRYRVKKLDPVKVKGKEKPVQIYSVKAIKPA